MCISLCERAAAPSAVACVSFPFILVSKLALSQDSATGRCDESNVTTERHMRNAAVFHEELRDVIMSGESLGYSDVKTGLASSAQSGKSDALTHDLRINHFSKQ